VWTHILFGSKQPATDPDITASALTGKHPTSKLAFSVLGYNILGLKVFTDAHMPVTHEEGDRYPLGPPSFCRQWRGGHLLCLILVAAEVRLLWSAPNMR
jgi:hypothetical protein